jgi:putative membrane protein
MLPPSSSYIVGAMRGSEPALADPTPTVLATRRPVAARLLGAAERLLLGAGVVLFVILVRRLGPATVWANLRMIGWGFVLVLAQEGVSYLLNTWGWRFTFPQSRGILRFRDLLAARFAGEAINNLTPTATIGGEVVRGRMLSDRADPSAVWASIAVAKLTQTFAQMVFVFLGLAIVVRDAPLPAGFRHGLLLGLVVLTTALLTGVAMQRRGMFMAAVRLATGLGLRVPERLRDQLARLDAEIGRFYAAPGAFAMSVSAFFVAWCMGIVEVYVVLWCLDAGPSWTRAATVEVLSVGIDALLFFVPAKAGTQEGGKVLIFGLLGLDPAKGLTLGIVRRLRELSWSMVGLIVLARHHARRRTAAQ